MKVMCVGDQISFCQQVLFLIKRRCLCMCFSLWVLCSTRWLCRRYYLPGYRTSIGFNGNSEIGFISVVFSLHYRLVLARLEWLQSKTPSFNPPWFLDCSLVLEENRSGDTTTKKNGSFGCFPTPPFFLFCFVLFSH